ncbi:MAG TPA: glycosyltransferase family 39 protein [Candidatus Paceibacterota bacterium]|nr:glycosyltransferase family 39 protein [Candidatus Paceibacterota bacterium]
MAKNKTLYLLLLILIIAGFFRLYHITTTPPGLYPDEAMNGNNALQAAQTGDYKVFYPENNGREGLFMNIQSLFLRFFAVNEPWVLRLPSAIFGILTVLGIYLLAKELFSVRIGLLSAFFAATSFWHIMFSRIGFRAIMAPFFAVWAFYFLLKAFRSPNSKFQVPSSVIGGIFYGLGFYSYIAYRITPLLLLLFIPFFAREKGFWKVAGTFLLTTFFVALPIGIYFLQHPADFMGRTSEISIFSAQSPLKDLAVNVAKTLGMFNFVGDWNWRQNYAGAPELFWPVGILFILGVILGIKNLISKSKFEAPNSKFPYWILFFWFFLAMLPVVISNEGIPHALRSILMIPPVMILCGIGGIAIYDWIKKRIPEYWVRAAVAFFIAFVVSNAYYMYFIAWANNPNVQGAFAADYVALGRQLNSLPVSVPKYIVVDAGGVLANGIPMPAQTVMFITGTFTAKGQAAKNIHYVLPADEKNIPAGSEKFWVR